MKYLLTKEESEKLFPGLKDMPKGEITGELNPPMKGESHPNYIDGRSEDKKAYRLRPEYKEYQKEYKEKTKEKQSEYNKKYRLIPEVKERIKNKRQRPEYKEYMKEYMKEYAKAYRAKKKQELYNETDRKR